MNWGHGNWVALDVIILQDVPAVSGRPQAARAPREPSQRHNHCKDWVFLRSEASHLPSQPGTCAVTLLRRPRIGGNPPRLFVASPAKRFPDLRIAFCEGGCFWRRRINFLPRLTPYMRAR